MAQNTAPTGFVPFTGELDKPTATTTPNGFVPFTGELDAPKRTIADYARDVGAVAVKGAIAVPEAIVGLADIPTGGAVGKFLENEGGAVGFRPKQAKEAVNEWHSDATKEAQRKFQAAEGIGNKAIAAWENPSVVATTIGESIPSMLTGGIAARGILAASKLGQAGAAGARIAGAIGEGVMGAGSAAEQIRQQTDDGLLSPGQMAAAAGTGLATAAFGALGGKVASKLGIGDVDTMIAQGAMNSAGQATAKSIPRQVVEGAISEGLLEELPQSVSEQLLQNLALNKPWDEGMDEAAVLGTLAGMGMGGAASGVSGISARNTPAPQDTPQDPTTSPGAADPNAPVPPGVAPVEAPDLQTSLGAGVPRDGMDFTREVDTSGLSLEDPAEVERDRAARMDYQPGDTTPQWDTAPGVAQDRMPGLDMPSPEFDTGNLGLESRSRELAPPSVQMGLNPSDGPLSKGAAYSVDSGVTAALQEAQFIGATGRDMTVRRTGPGVTNESNVIDVQGRVIEDRAIGTPRRLTDAKSLMELGSQAFSQGVPRAQIASIPNVAERAAALRGYDQAAKAAPATPALPAPATNVLERIRQNREAAARMAQLSQPQEQRNVPQAPETVQAIAQQQEAGGQATAGAAAAPAAGTAAIGGSRVQAAGVSNGAPTENPGAQAAAEASPQGTAQAVRYGRNSQPLNEGGLPFRTRRAADTQKRLQPMMRVVSVPGGYALAPKTERQIAAEQRAAQRLRQARTSPRGEPIPAHSFIASAGGLQAATRSDLGVDGNPRIGNRRLFAAPGRGLSIEQATEMLVAEGYLSEGASHNDAYALIKKSLSQPQYNADGIEQIAEAEAAAQFDDYLALEQEAERDPWEDAQSLPFDLDDADLDASGYDDATPEIKAEVRALLEMAAAMGIDTAMIQEDAAESTRNGTFQDYYAAAKSALQAAIAASNRNSSTPDGSESTARATSPAEATALELTAPTAADIAAQQDREEQSAREEAARQRAANAAAEQDENRKRIAQASVRAADTFELGQDPLDSLTGQRGMFDDVPQSAAKQQQEPKPQQPVAGEGGDLPMFSRSPAAEDSYLTDARTAWGKTVDSFVRGEFDRTKPVEMIGKTPAVMQMLGLPDLPVRIGAHGLDSLYNHGVTPSQLKAMVDQLIDPALVMVWNKGRPDDLSINFVTNLSNKDGLPFVIGLKPNSDSRTGKTHYVATITEKSPASIISMVRDGGALYVGDNNIPGVSARALAGAIQWAKENRGVQARELKAVMASRFKLEPLGVRTLYSKDLDAFKSGRGLMFSRDSVPADSEARNAATEFFVDGLAENWKRAPQSIVARNMQDAQVPQEVRDYDALLKSQGATGEPRGFIYQGQVYLLSDQLKGPRQIAEVLFHEVLGHYGLRGAFGKELDNILRQIGTMRRKEVVAKAREYGLFDKDALGADKDAVSDSQIWAAMSEQDRLSAAEEVLAEMAQTKPELGFVQRAIAAIRNWLRANVPGFDAMKLSDSDIVQAYILPARGFVTRSNETTQQAIDRAMLAFSRSESTDQTQTEAFKRWFAGSQVVDADGKPLASRSGLVVAREAAMSEGRPNGGTSNSKPLADLLVSKPFSLQGLSGLKVPLQREVLNGVLSLGDDLKVLWSVVQFIPVDVVNILARKNLAPEMLFRDEAVLKNLLSADSDGSVSTAIDVADALVAAVARMTAEGAPIAANPFAGSSKGGAAANAGDRNELHGGIVNQTTGNNGTFDPSNPDIRFSRATATGAATWDTPAQSAVDDMIYKLQDKNIDLKRVIEAITKAVGQVSDSVNAYLKEELFHKRAAKRVEDFGARELKPLLTQMRLAGLSMEDVEEYLHARHAKEANAVIAERNPDNPGLQDGGSGMTNQAADNYFAKLDPAQRRKLEAVAAKVDAIIAETRKLYVSYGLEDQAVVDGWASMYQHYIPLMREDKEGGMGIGQGFSVKGKETKGRTGSTRKVVDILANIAAQREKVIVRGEKNRVTQALVGLAQANPNPEFWEVRSQAPTERVFDPKSGVVVERPDPMFKNRENVVVTKVKDSQGNVTEQMVVFNEDNPRAVRMAAALKNLDAGNLEGLLGVSAKITRYFSAINTQYNPVFGVVNLVRDVQGAMVNLGATPLAGQQGKIAKDTLSALRGIYGDIRKTRKGGQANSQWSQLWEQMQDDGGTTGYRDLFKTSADRAENLKSILNPEGWMDSKWGKFFTADGRLKVPLGMAQNGAGALFDWLSDYNEAMENGVRLAAYKAALDKGMSREQAASLAKNLTVNFNRKGQVGQQAGAMYAFFNAAMQGTARIGQTLFDMDGGDISTLRLSKTGKAVVYGGVLIGVMQALALAGAGFDEEDPPEFVRERSLIIPTGNKTYVSIPMPLGLHVIPGIGRHATEFALSGFDKPAKRAVSVIGMFADAFNPIGNAGLSMQTIAPTALDPLVALTENKDWTGNPIARVSSNKALPGHTQWKDSATGISKVVAEAINWVSGGNEYVAGAFSPTPDQIDYLLAQVGGGVAREAAKVQQTVSAALSGESLPTHKVPLVGRFVGNAFSQASQGTAFYTNLNKLNELETEIKGLRKDGKYDEAAKLVRENPQSILIPLANKAERDVQKLRREKRELIAKDASRDEVRAKEDQITAVMLRLNEAAARRKAEAR